MSKITWDSMEDRLYETGVDHVVLYTLSGDEYISGIPWNGVTSVDPGKSSGNSNTLYSGGLPSIVTIDTEGTEGKISTFGYPSVPKKANAERRHFDHFGIDELAEGLSIKTADRTPCGLCYRTMSSSATGDSKDQYKLHLLYGVVFTGETRRHSTITNSSTEPVEYTFDYTIVGETSDQYGIWYDEIILDSRTCDQQVLAGIETILYGSADEDPRLPYVEEIMDYFTAYLPLPEGYEYYPYEVRFPRSDVYPLSGGS